MSTFSMFEIGKSALIASKRSMDVTSHNIANAATPGYSRQDAFLEPIIQRQSYISGVGVRVADIRRTRDVFVDAVLRNEIGREAAYLVQQEVLDHVQTAFAEPGDGSLRAVIDSFWAAWEDVASDPGSISAKAQLMERGRSLVDLFNHLAYQLDSVSDDIDTHIKSLVDRVNDLAGRVAALNVEIARALARQEPAADLMDRRDLLLDELAELTGGSVTYIGEGNAVRFTVGGFPLVDRDRAYEIEAHISGNETEIRWKSSSEDNSPKTISSVGGRIGGLQAAKADIVVKFRKRLEDLFKDIVEGVNARHQDADGNLKFFEVDPAGPYLGAVKVNPEMVADPSKIITTSPDGASPGNIAHEIADFLANGGQLTPGDDSSNVDPFVETWTAIIGELGAQAQKIETGAIIQGLLVKELRNRRDSISGVSVDEEVANLIRQQHAFSAASRVITIADEMIDTIINRMGIAGR